MLLSEYDQSAVKLASKAWGQIFELNLKREVASPKSGLLYHYTVVEGLKGIIERNELWASSAYFLNDSAEIIYGYGVLKDVLDAWLAKSRRPEESFTLGLVRDLRKWFGEDLLERHVIDPIYLACFCEDDNLLSQWRTYGQSGAYSLGFRVPADAFSNQGFKPEPNTYTSRWIQVEYERKGQISKCSACLEQVLNALDAPEVVEAIRTIGDHPILGYSKLLRTVGDILVEEIVGFKHEAFSVEKEWRIVVRRRELTKQGTDDDGKTPTPIYFRSSNGSLIPYVKLIPIDHLKKLPIACIRSGPTLEKTTTVMAICMLLEKSGFSGVRVRGSDITVRL